MSNKFQPWSEIEDEILLEELSDNKSINEIAHNHKRTYGAINMRIGRIAYQLVLDNENIDIVMKKTKLTPKQLYATINKYSKSSNHNPIHTDDTLRYTYSILFHFNNQEIIRENGVFYKLLSYCENNCMKVVNSIRMKKELDELLDGDYCFCNIQIMNNKNKVIREVVNIKYPFKRPIDGDDLLNV
jgi:hypothetical protein